MPSANRLHSGNFRPSSGPDVDRFFDPCGEAIQQWCHPARGNQPPGENHPSSPAFPRIRSEASGFVMTIELYGHPFAAFVWKPLIAAYERDVPFTFRMVDQDHPENARRMAQLSPTGQFPALVDGERSVTQSNAVIEYLDRFGSAPAMIPADADAALNSRMLADVFDSYVAGPMQSIVGEALRPKERQDPGRVDAAKASLDKTYAWLADRIGATWANGISFSIADCAAAPALFYADWVHAIPEGPLKAYRLRLLEHPSVARVVDEARPYRPFFPLGAPDRD